MEPPAATDNSLRARVAALHARHAGKTLVLFFLGGFLFDAVMLSRIDEPGMLIQQGAYLLLCGTLLAVTQRMELKQLEPPRVLRKAWHYVDHVIHFMLGTLLNAYSIFYFRSASGLTALGFVVVIVALLALNELPRFQKLGPVVLYALYSICLTSYLAYLLPVLLGYIRPWMFYLAVGAALLPLTLHVLLLLRWGRAFGHVARHAAIPAYGVQLAFLLVYALRIAPPVPLAVKEMGIYHDVQRAPGGRRLLQQKRGWKFWQKGDQDFLERDGDKVWCFARIFAPAHFRDRLDIVWYRDDPQKGWIEYHRFASTVAASSARGFATEGYLTHPPPGRYRVEIQSGDRRTMGLLHFQVIPDGGSGPRDFIESFSEAGRMP
jgi:hypothetical protein